LERIRACGVVLSQALGEVLAAVRPGVRMVELDTVAREAIFARGGEPSFLNYTQGGHAPFPASVCISRNDEVIHGVGTRADVLHEGDVVGFDIGCWLENVCTDMAYTVGVGTVRPEAARLMAATRRSLQAGIAAARAGVPLQSISAAIEQVVREEKLGLVTAYVGHGVGHAVHEDPAVPNFTTQAHPNPLLESGMVLALEPMVTLGKGALTTGADGWAARTRDGSLGAHFEQTIIIGERGAEVVTPWPEGYA
jgi:methionyl aminopeptidase